MAPDDLEAAIRAAVRERHSRSGLSMRQHAAALGVNASGFAHFYYGRRPLFGELKSAIAREYPDLIPLLRQHSLSWEPDTDSQPQAAHA